MAKLLLLAACEQAIVDLNNTLTLMKLIGDINVQVPGGTTPPRNAGVPLQWAIVAIFEQEPSDQNKKFEQYFALVSSSGDILFQSQITPFEFKLEQHRITVQANGMPIGHVGKHHVKCYIREKGNNVWSECGSYPFRVQWVPSLIATPN